MLVRKEGVYIIQRVRERVKNDLQINYDCLFDIINVTSLKGLNDEQMYDIITLMPHN